MTGFILNILSNVSRGVLVALLVATCAMNEFSVPLRVYQVSRHPVILTLAPQPEPLNLKLEHAAAAGGDRSFTWHRPLHLRQKSS